MRELLLASNNPGKLAEFKALLQKFPTRLVTPVELEIDLEVEEDGQTYAENAVKKAIAFARLSGYPTLADDSGLEVDALDGQPGLRSHRYAPKPGASDADRRAYLLEKLHGIPRPWTARFRCWIAVAYPTNSEGRVEVRLAEGICPGEILPEERGANGFGYDPVFLLPERELTMAELPTEEKNLLSHRARAVQAAIPLLQEIFKPIS
jgi:XTP/dITP diphosphohydrolase